MDSLLTTKGVGKSNFHLLADLAHRPPVRDNGVPSS